ncbi:YdcH family protein [Vibrio sp. WXL103]|uniref:YdcH family protein n=1 Tax=unclassified Vibrio TaxID=2614977 RepID=UPI0030E2420A
MLGEVHSLNNDFPEHEAAINKLKETDADFLNSMKEYDAIDKQIRTLELNGAPIGDDQMHQLKHDRAVLKDSLYKRLVNGK